MTTEQADDPLGGRARREERRREADALLLGEAKALLFAAIAREQKRLARRLVAVEGDLAKGRQAEAAASEARLFVREAARASRGAVELRAVDWSTGEAIERVMQLDPAKRPRDQVEAVFAKARRLKRGAAVAAGRMEDARVKLDRLARLEQRLQEVATMEELEEAEKRARREDPALLPARTKPAAPGTPGARAKGKPDRVPYRAFVAPSGTRILVGKGATDNDELTLHVARPHDLWLHVKDQPGAHVVVPMAKGHDPPAEVLVDAAHLAAHFSDAREEPVVDVAYVQKRYVRKPRGAAPGLVKVDREKVLALRVDPARLSALLAREEAG